MKDIIWPIIWQSGTLIFFGMTTYATMWVKANAPTRVEFNELKGALQNLHNDFLLRAGHGERLDDHEERIRKLEKDVLTR